VVQEANYRQGKQDGLTKVYANGRVMMEQNFQAGELHGETRTFSDAGDLTTRQIYRKGELEGEAVFMHEGQVVRRARAR
jgi:antitoxin component YwqK of YwqJK toxin-antitoxin module